MKGGQRRCCDSGRRHRVMNGLVASLVKPWGVHCLKSWMMGTGSHQAKGQTFWSQFLGGGVEKLCEGLTLHLGWRRGWRRFWVGLFAAFSSGLVAVDWREKADRYGPGLPESSFVCVQTWTLRPFGEATYGSLTTCLLLVLQVVQRAVC